MEIIRITRQKEGSQYEPFSEETDLLKNEEIQNNIISSEKKHTKMASFKEFREILQNMDYPWTFVSEFY